MSNISALGTQVKVIASKSFPIGFDVADYADDVDGLVFDAQDIANTAMTLNGNLLVWNKATPIPISISVVPGGSDDQNLGVIFVFIRVAVGTMSVKDLITFVIPFPDGRIVTVSGGTMISGQSASSVSSDGRFKTKTYTFQFESKVST